MNHTPSVIIIGAGIAGLSAGCYARMNGFETNIFEMGYTPGGVCTNWKVGEYTVNGCIHWLVGSSPSVGFYRLWNELGALEGQKFVDHDVLFRAEGVYEGQDFVFPVLVDELEAYLLELAPEDEKQLRKLIEGIRVFSEQDPPLHEPKGMGGKLLFMMRNLSIARQMFRWWNISIQDFADRLKNPLVRKGLLEFWHPEMSIMALMMTLSFANKRSAGYPMGGSAPFSMAIQKRFRKLGGKLHYGAEVEEILVKDNKAVGVRLLDGREFFADYVISAADGYSTHFKFLKERYLTKRIRKWYDELPLFPPILVAGIGVDDPFEGVEPTVSGASFPVAEPFTVGERTYSRVSYQLYNFDPAMAPEGKSVLVCMLEADWEFWAALRKDEAAYKAEKARILRHIVEALDGRFPGIKDKVEAVDLATPWTYYRYTHNYRGAYEGWLPTMKAIRAHMSMLVPGLDQFYMVGHWVTPGGGLPPAAWSGRQAIVEICEREKVGFVTSEPD